MKWFGLRWELRFVCLWNNKEWPIMRLRDRWGGIENTVRIRVVEQTLVQVRWTIRSIWCNCDSYCGGIDRWKEATLEGEGLEPL